MEILGSIGIILGIIAIIYMAVKGINILIAAPLATILIVLTNNMDIVDSMLGTKSDQFMGALGKYLMSYFIIFLLGSILAKLMEASGATSSIANFILKKLGTDKPYSILLAIFIVGFILTYGGISLFVVIFALVPLSKALFKKLDIAWNLIQIPLFLGIITVTMTMLPGTPAIQNVIPIQYLNTSLTAAAIPSILGSIGCTAFGLFYMKYCLDKSIKKGENFSTYASKEEVEEKSIKEQDLPSFFTSILPLLILIVIALSGSLFGDEYIKKNIIYVALVIAVVLSLIIFNKYIPDKISNLTLGANGSVMAIMATSAAVAFGSVAIAAPGFDVFSNLIKNIPGSPLISLSVLTSAMSAITGSASGALGIVMPNFADYYLSTGLNPELIHRVASIASNVTTLVPQCGVVLTFLTITKLNFKNGFKESFITVTFGSLISLIIVITVGLIMYPS